MPPRRDTSPTRAKWGEQPTSSVPARNDIGENSASELIDEMYWTTLSRAPTDEETRKMADHLVKTKTHEERRRAVEDTMWALLNSKEFLFRR